MKASWQIEIDQQYNKGILPYSKLMEHYKENTPYYDWWYCQQCTTLRPEIQIQDGKCIYCGHLAFVEYSAKAHLEKTYQWRVNLYRYYRWEQDRIEAQKREFWFSLYKNLGNHGEYVYFIKTEEGHIKIGTSQDLERRFRELEYTFGKIEFLAVLAGGRQVEQSIHKLFAHHRAPSELSRELFSPKESILFFIEHFCEKVDYAHRMW